MFNVIAFAIGLGCTFTSVSALVAGNTQDAGLSTSFRDIVTFGDSFSDSGNAFRLTNGTWPADPAYFKGRFSNGPVWVENVAKHLHLGLHDYAIGGATSDNKLVQGYTGPNSTIAVPSVVEQVSQYLASDAAKTNVENTLFVILVGGNDAFFSANVTGAQSAAVVSAVVQRLGHKGAKHFLVVSSPDMSRLPYDTYVPSSTANQLHIYSKELRASIENLQGPSVAYFDLFQLLDNLLDDPVRYGFDKSKITKSCLTGAYGEAPRTLCDDPDRYIFWDEYHPTSKTHRLIASAAQSVIRDRFQ